MLLYFLIRKITQHNYCGTYTILTCSMQQALTGMNEEGMSHSTLVLNNALLILQPHCNIFFKTPTVHVVFFAATFLHVFTCTRHPSLFITKNILYYALTAFRNKISGFHSTWLYSYSKKLAQFCSKLVVMDAL